MLYLFVGWSQGVHALFVTCVLYWSICVWTCILYWSLCVDMYIILVTMCVDMCIILVTMCVDMYIILVTMCVDMCIILVHVLLHVPALCMYVCVCSWASVWKVEWWGSVCYIASWVHWMFSTSSSWTCTFPGICEQWLASKLLLIVCVCVYVCVGIQCLVQCVYVWRRSYRMWAWQWRSITETCVWRHYYKIPVLLNGRHTLSSLRQVMLYFCYTLSLTNKQTNKQTISTNLSNKMLNHGGVWGHLFI